MFVFLPIGGESRFSDRETDAPTDEITGFYAQNDAKRSVDAPSAAYLRFGLQAEVREHESRYARPRLLMIANQGDAPVHPRESERRRRANQDVCAESSPRDNDIKIMSTCIALMERSSTELRPIPLPQP